MKRRVLRALVCSVLCAPMAACSSDDTEPGTGGGSNGVSLADGYENGSRLHAVLRVADQAAMFSTWHDTELDIDCAFALASDGTTRCLPVNAYTNSYGDADCTMPIAVFQEDEEVAKYVFKIDEQLTCGTGYEVYETGDVIEGTSFYSLSAGECVPATVANTATVLSLPEVATLDTFVGQKSVDSQKVDDRLSAQVLVADDGARQVVGFHDATREVDCMLTDASQEEAACVPTPVAYIETHYGDSGCEELIAFYPGYSQGPCDREPKIVLDATGKTSEPTYSEIGAKVGGQVYQNYGACEAYDPPASLLASFYEIGESAPISSFATLTKTNEGEGRIQLVTLRREGDEMVATQGFYDTDFSSLCYGLYAADGKSRCLPLGRLYAHEFADSSCSEALVGMTAGEAAPAAGAFVEASAGGNKTGIFKLGGKITPPATVYQRNPDCEPGTPIPEYDYYETEAVPAADFVEVELATE